MISSRTPEGLPNRCPVCSAQVWVEPLSWFGDAPCPHCGSLLWFVSLEEETHFFKYEEAENLRQKIANFVSRQTGLDRDAIHLDRAFLERHGVDFLDLVELVMEIEEETG